MPTQEKDDEKLVEFIDENWPAPTLRDIMPLISEDEQAELSQNGKEEQIQEKRQLAKDVKPLLDIEEEDKLMPVNEQVDRDAALRASKDPEALLRALEEMQKETEAEAQRVKQEIEQSKKNIDERILEIYDEKNKGTETTILENEVSPKVEALSGQKEKLSKLVDKIKNIIEKKNEITARLEQEKPSTKEGRELFTKMCTGLMETYRTLTAGLKSIGNMLHTKNEQFKAGVRTAMDYIGDRAQVIYARTMDRVKSISQWMVRETTKAKMAVKEAAKTAAMAPVKAAQTVVEYERSGIVRESLDNKILNAMVAKKITEKTEGEGRGSLVNAMHNMALDSWKKDIDAVRDVLDHEVARINEREKKGLPVREEQKNYLESRKKDLDGQTNTVFGRGVKQMQNQKYQHYSPER